MPPWIWSSAKYYEIFYIQAVKGMNLQYYVAIVKAKKTNCGQIPNSMAVFFVFLTDVSLISLQRKEVPYIFFCKIENKNETRQY